jgi:hypothetical protein
MTSESFHQDHPRHLRVHQRRQDHGVPALRVVALQRNANSGVNLIKLLRPEFMQ